MKIGHLFLIPSPNPTVSYADRYGQIRQMVEHANTNPYSSVWFTEHHFSDYSWSPNPLIFLANIAPLAPHLRLGTAVNVLPLWNPLRLAEDVAMLDVLSGGRVDFGVGRGYQDYEFVRLGADVAENREVFRESMEIILAAWSSEAFEYKGAHWELPETFVTPKPLQTPHPPIWMAATSPPSIRTAVANGYHLATGTGALFDELRMRNAFIDTTLESMERSPEGIERAVNRFIFCSTDQAAIDEAIDASRWQIRVSRGFAQGAQITNGRNTARPWPGEPPPHIWQERMIIGDPDECLRRIQELAKAGISYIYGLFDFGGLDHDKAMASLNLFSAEVLPAALELEPHRLTTEEREQVTSEFLRAGPGYQGV